MKGALKADLRKYKTWNPNYEDGQVRQRITKHYTFSFFNSLIKSYLK